MENLPQNLRLILNARGWSQARLARELGVAEATISRYMTCDRTPDRATVQRMAYLLQVEDGEITGEIPIMTDEERAFLRSFRAIPAHQRAALAAIMQALAAPASDDAEPKRPDTELTPR